MTEDGKSKRRLHTLAERISVEVPRIRRRYEELLSQGEEIGHNLETVEKAIAHQTRYLNETLFGESSFDPKKLNAKLFSNLREEGQGLIRLRGEFEKTQNKKKEFKDFLDRHYHHYPFECGNAFETIKTALKDLVTDRFGANLRLRSAGVGMSTFDLVFLAGGVTKGVIDYSDVKRILKKRALEPFLPWVNLRHLSESLRPNEGLEAKASYYFDPKKESSLNASEVCETISGLAKTIIRGEVRKIPNDEIHFYCGDKKGSEIDLGRVFNEDPSHSDHRMKISNDNFPKNLSVEVSYPGRVLNYLEKEMMQYGTVEESRERYKILQAFSDYFLTERDGSNKRGKVYLKPQEFSQTYHEMLETKYGVPSQEELERENASRKFDVQELTQKQWEIKKAELGLNPGRYTLEAEVQREI